MFFVDVPKIRGRMAEKGYTNTALAKDLGISRNTLSAYFANPEKIPYETLEKMSGVLFDSVEEARTILFAQKLSLNARKETR